MTNDKEENKIILWTGQSNGHRWHAAMETIEMLGDNPKQQKEFIELYNNFWGGDDDQ